MLQDFLRMEEGTVKRERGRKDTPAKLHLEEIFWRRMRILGTAYFVVLCTWGLTVLFFYPVGENTDFEF